MYFRIIRIGELKNRRIEREEYQNVELPNPMKKTVDPILLWAILIGRGLFSVDELPKYFAISGDISSPPFSSSLPLFSILLPFFFILFRYCVVYSRASSQCEDRS
jgi:hypothetical protein